MFLRVYYRNALILVFRNPKIGSNVSPDDGEDPRLAGLVIISSADWFVAEDKSSKNQKTTI